MKYRTLLLASLVGLVGCNTYYSEPQPYYRNRVIVANETSYARVNEVHVTSVNNSARAPVIVQPVRPTVYVAPPPPPAPRGGYHSFSNAKTVNATTSPAPPHVTVNGAVPSSTSSAPPSTTH